ncbi:EthD domain-containing protein [Frankia sp. EAN1pec]|uniref:EthD domain-containing protein n=1 Tax=Parafrankia sp. (strain EAN1pec) TaxID=298653 RepID=UPI0007C54526
MMLSKRRPGLSMAEFVEKYETRHAPYAAEQMPTARRYVRRYFGPLSTADQPDDEREFDVATEIWFDDRAAYERAMERFADPVVAARLAQDAQELFDPGRSTLRVHVEEQASQPGGGDGPVGADQGSF